MATTLHQAYSLQVLRRLGLAGLGLSICLSLLAISAPVFAQTSPNVKAPPLSGSFTLRSGFSPSPFDISVNAGGRVDARSLNLGPNCVGFINPSQPNVRVQYQSGDWPLSFFVDNYEVDTTLLINGPDGRWYCNDDYNGLNPQINFSSPISGQYDIWVGTYISRPLSRSILSITEF